MAFPGAGRRPVRAGRGPTPSASSPRRLLVGCRHAAGLWRSETHFALRGSCSEPSAFLRVLQRLPLHHRFTGCVLPKGFPSEATRLPATPHVPSSRFLPASTACATRRFAGLLHPADGHGVHRVSDPGRRVPATDGRPPHRCDTLQSVSLPDSRNDVTVARAPSPFLALTRGSTSRPCSIGEVRCVHPPDEGRRRPWLSWASLLESDPPNHGRGRMMRRLAPTGGRDARQLPVAPHRASRGARR